MEKMDELHESLKSKVLKPIHIKLYAGGNLEEQWSQPSFGTQGYASYEILYYRLVNKYDYIVQLVLNFINSHIENSR
jgi:hypothetical protein